MMRTLASTQILFGGFTANSDDDAPFIHHLTRLIASSADVMECINQICHLLFILLPLLINISHKVLYWMDVIEAMAAGMRQAGETIAEGWRVLWLWPVNRPVGIG